MSIPTYVDEVNAITQVLVPAPMSESTQITGQAIALRISSISLSSKVSGRS